MEKKRVAETFGVAQLFRMFPDEDACWKWLEKVRWRGEPVCPHCGAVEKIGSPPPSKPHHWWCKSCRKHFTATTGTVMHSRRRPLQDWVYVIYLVLTARKGVSALQLKHELGCHYRTSWHMLHRVREACAGGDFKLDGIVEIDEMYVGGKEANKHADKKLNAGRGTVGKVPVLGMRERGGKLIAKPIEGTDKGTIQGEVFRNVKTGSTIFTDEHGAYGGLGPLFFDHQSVNHSLKQWVDGICHTNSIESVWAVLRRSIVGSWHHVSRKHLIRYVNEAAFRLNEGNCEIDTIDRMEALVRGMAGKRVRYVDLVAENGISSVVCAV